MFRVPSAWLVVLLLGLGPGLAACESACSALADRICECEPNRAEEDVCKLKVDLAANRELSDAENQACETQLDTCTCEALERDDLQACGLAKPIGSS